jgi:hydroxypyruvate isomerase
MKYSANTGFLWKDEPFLDRIAKAAAVGFDALEFHDEAQRADPAALEDALAAAGLPVLGINVEMGETAGCAAIPGREAAARNQIDTALRVADSVDAKAIHVMAGKTNAPGAAAAYTSALAHACDNTHRTILIEPISPKAMPGYFMESLDHALRVIEALGRPNLKIMFDTFHIADTEDDVPAAYARAAPHVAHVQIAAWPGRGEPTGGELDHAALLPWLVKAGYTGAVGLEYRPSAPIADTLAALRAAVG